MDLIFMNSNLEDIGVLKEYDLDLAFGADENDFECQILSSAHCCQPGWYLYIEGTEYGGVIDRIEVDTGGGNLTYKGRTWHGMLDSKVLEPDSGEAYLTVTGEANAIIASLLSRIGLSGLFVASSESSGININSYQMNRYVTAYNGITKMLNSVGAKLRVIFQGGKVVLSAVLKKVDDQDEELDSDLIDFVMEKNYRAVNHLVCLGKGELTERMVVHLFADGNGNISRTQTFFGVDEYMQVFDYPSAETEEELVSSGTDRLKELQETSEVSVDCDETDDTYDVGDVVSAYDNVTGMAVSAVIEKKVVTIINGRMSIILTPGSNKNSSSSSGSSGSGGGGGSTVAWEIGNGLKLTDNILSVDTADVMEKDNTLPITSSAVFVEVGNINTLLATI